MNPQVSIIMGSISDMSVMEEAARFLNQMEIPFEIKAFRHTAPRTRLPNMHRKHHKGDKGHHSGRRRGSAPPGIIAAYTSIPVIGVPVKSAKSLEGLDSILSILQMPAGIPVATMALDGARNAAIFAARILALSDSNLAERMIDFQHNLNLKIEEANESIKEIKYRFKI